MIPFFSKRNQIYPVIRDGRRAVEKHFLLSEDWAAEMAAYRAFASVLPCPQVLHAAPNLLVTEFCPFPTLLQELERQEREGFDPAPWNALMAWLVCCHERFGCLPDEGNLRNFLWDAENGQVLGLDFENFRCRTLSDYGAVLAATLLEYDPIGTDAKRRAAALLTERMGTSEKAVSLTGEALRRRRREHTARMFSGIILAGGLSSRMGSNKAELVLGGKTLLEHQVDRLRELGIDDIILSGAACAEIEGTRVVSDIYPRRGPLGGLHACLQAAKHPQVLVLGVDVPLVPLSVLNHLCRAHTEGGVTVLRHGDKQEPLIGVYDSNLSDAIAGLIAEKSASVRALAQIVPWTYWDYLGPEELLLNCNAPEEFEKIRGIFERFSEVWQFR